MPVAFSSSLLTDCYKYSKFPPLIAVLETLQHFKILSVRSLCVVLCRGLLEMAGPFSWFYCVRSCGGKPPTAFPFSSLLCGAGRDPWNLAMIRTTQKLQTNKQTNKMYLSTLPTQPHLIPQNSKQQGRESTSRGQETTCGLIRDHTTMALRNLDTVNQKFLGKIVEVLSSVPSLVKRKLEAST